MALPVFDPKTKQWMYSGEGWTEDRRTQFEAAQGQQLAETRRMADVSAAAARTEEDPATLIARAQVAAADATRAREHVERQASGDAAWLAARALHGADVCQIPSDEGDVFVLKSQSDAETSALKMRAQNLRNGAMASAMSSAGGQPTAAAMMAAELRGGNDALGVYRDAILSHLLHPTKERADAFLARKPLFWDLLYDARDKMISGARVAEGKDFAP